MSEALPEHDGLLRWEALQEWINAQPGIPGHGPVTSAQKLAGGSQNNIFLLSRDDAQMVLRRPPRHPRPNSNETMLREARVLRALADTDVPHPTLYATCDDVDVIGVNFYVMAPITGFSPTGSLPEKFAAEPTWRREIAFQLVEGATRLAAVDHAAVGLADLGKPAWLDRQVDRWRSQLDGYAKFEGYESALPGIEEIAAWLDANRPDATSAGLIHGDYHLSNVMIAPDAPKLAAIVDWELCTVGDPMIDLGTLLATWMEPDDPPREGAPFEPWENMPTRAELIDRYGELSGRDMTSAPWFFVLACYKLGIVLEGTYARAAAGLAPRETGDQLHAMTLRFLKLAHRAIASR